MMESAYVSWRDPGVLQELICTVICVLAAVCINVFFIQWEFTEITVESIIGELS